MDNCIWPVECRIRGRDTELRATAMVGGIVGCVQSVVEVQIDKRAHMSGGGTCDLATGELQASNQWDRLVFGISIH